MRDMALNMPITGSLQTKVTKNGSVYYYLVVDFPRKKGEKRQVKWISTKISADGTKKSQKAAEKFRADKLYELNSAYIAEQRQTGVPLSAGAVTRAVEGTTTEEYLSVRDAIEIAKVYKSTTVTETTLKIYQLAYKRFAAYVGEERNFWELTERDILSYLLTKKYKEVTFNNNLTYLTNLFRVVYSAYEREERIKTIKKRKEPGRTYEMPKQDFYSYVIESLYGEHEDVDLGKKTPNGYGKRYRALFFFLAFGMRSGEICGLKWSDIDFKRRVVTLNRHVVNAKVYPYTKNGHTRSVMIPESGIAMLKKDMERTMKKHSLTEREVGERYILGGGLKPLSYRAMSAYYKAIRDYYYPVLYNEPAPQEMRMHDFRHGVASICMDQNIDLKSIGALIGHLKIATTERYVHTLNNVSAKTTPVIEALL